MAASVNVTGNAHGYTVTFIQDAVASIQWQYSVSTDGVVRELSAPGSPAGTAAATSPAANSGHN
ncbi:MAG TPA: hypothetical protein VK737_01850 [Opitutales bacterium]|jgi:hypothetical protein|nr:hypothetical protein [Opitutales bacterium]